VTASDAKGLLKLVGLLRSSWTRAAVLLTTATLTWSAAAGAHPTEDILGRTWPPKAILIGDSIARGAQGGQDFRATDTFAFFMFREGLFVSAMAHHLGVAANLPRYNEALEEQNAFDPWKFTMVLLGTNDYAQAIPIERVTARYAEFLDTAVRSPWFQFPKPGQTIFCVTPLTRAQEKKSNRAGYSLPDLRAAIRDLCTLRSLPVIEGPDLLPTDPTLASGHESLLFTDGIHPNKLAHRLLGQHLLNRAILYFAGSKNGSPMRSITPAERDARGGPGARICPVPR